MGPHEEDYAAPRDHQVAYQRYNPLQVAKYVKILFRGRLYIKDVGAFEFDKGKILIPKVKDKLHLSVMSEVNRQVMRLQTEMA
ncbi:DUF1107 domain-containing protein [Escherichia coli]|uniref:DUF1107 domain-containing protein n=1 Tax=Escherichia coli TaxID=562 RepID=UPI001B3C9DEB|nr:DUF1107 family protein [Escherichia coli]